MERSKGTLVIMLVVVAALVGGGYLLWQELGDDAQGTEVLSLGDESEDRSQDDANSAQGNDAKAKAEAEERTRLAREGDREATRKANRETKERNLLSPTLGKKKDSQPGGSATPTAPEGHLPGGPNDPAEAIEMEEFNFSITISGRVVDGKREGVSGAMVQVIKPSGIDRDWIGAENGSSMNRVNPTSTIDEIFGESVSTSADGSFTISVSGEGKRPKSENPSKADRILRFALTASKDGLLTTHSANQRAPMVDGKATLADITIPIYSSASISGSVVHADDINQPFAGATVKLEYYGEWVDGKRSQIDSPKHNSSVTVGDDGVFAFNDLSPGTYNLTASIPGTQRVEEGVSFVVQGRGGSGEGASKTVSLSAGETMENIELRISEPGELRFSLSHPADNVFVKWENKANPSNRWVQTAQQDSPFSGGQRSIADSEGVYHVDGAEPTLIAVKIRAQGYAETRIEIQDAHRQGKDFDLGEITLDEGATITGRVVNKQGEPVVMAHLSISDVSQASPNRMWVGAWGEAGKVPEFDTDADGLFEIAGSPDGAFEMTIGHHLYAELKHKYSVKNGADLNLGDIVVNAGARVFGRVTVDASLMQPDENGDAPEIAVALMDASQPYIDFVDENSLAMMVKNASQHQAQTDEQGEYSITRVPPGTYIAIAVAGSRVQKKKGVKIEGEEELQINFNISAGVRVYGRISREDGSAVANQEIYLSRNLWGREASATTDARGEYHFDDISAGTWYLRMSSDPQRWDDAFRAERAIQVEADNDKEFNLELDDSGIKLFGTTTLEGKAIFNQIALHKRGETMPASQTDVESDGSWEIVGLEPGEYELWMQSWNGAGGETYGCYFFTIKDGVMEQDASHDFQAVKLAGKVIGASESELAGAIVSLRLDVPGSSSTSAGWRQIEITCDAQGQFIREDLVAGRYLMTARVAGYGVQSLAFELKAPSANVELPVGALAGSLVILIDDVQGDDTARETTGMTAGSIRVKNAKGESVDLQQMQSFVAALAQGTEIPIADLSTGFYSIEIDHPDFELISVQADVIAGETNRVSVNAYRSATIEIEIANPELTSADVKKAQIRVTDASGTPVNLGSTGFSFGGNEDGSKVSLVRVRKGGSYHVKLTLEGYEPYEVDTTVARSTNHRQVVTLVAK